MPPLVSRNAAEDDSLVEKEDNHPTRKEHAMQEDEEDHRYHARDKVSNGSSPNANSPPFGPLQHARRYNPTSPPSIMQSTSGTARLLPIEFWLEQQQNSRAPASYHDSSFYSGYDASRMAPSLSATRTPSSLSINSSGYPSLADIASGSDEGFRLPSARGQDRSSSIDGTMPSFHPPMYPPPPALPTDTVLPQASTTSDERSAPDSLGALPETTSNVQLSSVAYTQLVPMASVQCDMPGCNPSFGTGSGLRKHKNTAHRKGKKIYKCNTFPCNYITCSKSDMTRHCKSQGHEFRCEDNPAAAE